MRNGAGICRLFTKFSRCRIEQRSICVTSLFVSNSGGSNMAAFIGYLSEKRIVETANVTHDIIRHPVGFFGLSSA